MPALVRVACLHDLAVPSDSPNTMHHAATEVLPQTSAVWFDRSEYVWSSCMSRESLFLAGKGKHLTPGQLTLSPLSIRGGNNGTASSPIRKVQHQHASGTAHRLAAQRRGGSDSGGAGGGGGSRAPLQPCNFRATVQQQAAAGTCSRPQRPASGTAAPRLGAAGGAAFPRRDGLSSRAPGVRHKGSSVSLHTRPSPPPPPPPPRVASAPLPGALPPPLPNRHTGPRLRDAASLKVARCDHTTPVLPSSCIGGRSSTSTMEG